MTQQYSTLSVIKTTCTSFGVINTVQSISNHLDENNHCVVVLITNHTKNVPTQEKIVQALNKHFVSHINNGYLKIIISNDLSSNLFNIDLYNKYPNLLKYNWIIHIDPNTTYLNNLLADVICEINKYQTKFKVVSIKNSKDATSSIVAYNKETIVNQLNTKNITTQSLNSHEIILESLFNTNIDKHTSDKVYLDDTNFMLFWIEENEKAKLKSGYCFLYKKNNKIFNINNECHGVLSHFFDNSITITWFTSHNEVIKNTYYQHNKDEFYSCES